MADEREPHKTTSWQSPIGALSAAGTLVMGALLAAGMSWLNGQDAI